MKRTIAAFLLEVAVVCAYAQGMVSLNNVANTSTNPAATANGLFWVLTGGIPVLINQDFNAAFYGGANSSSLAPIAVFLMSNGTAVHDNNFGPGTFIDPTALAYPISGATESAFFRIQAWTGNFNSYAAAVTGGAAAAQSSIFINPLSVPPGSPQPLYGMPAMILSGIPEPSTLALAALGGLCALLVRRWWKCITRPRASR